jgi:hypothetical protein
VDGVCTICGEADPNYNPDEPAVTLTSISAVYSGGSVPVGTAVSELTGIVVTAHYSDGTSEAVTGYTLSGTIAEGNNIITVTYGGKTTTFTVTGVAESGGVESEPFVNLFTANLRDTTVDDKNAGIGSYIANYCNTDADIQLTGGVTYYAYSLFEGTTYALSVFVNNGSGTYTNSGLTVTKTKIFKDGGTDAFGNESSSGFSVDIDGTTYNLYQMAFTPTEDCAVRLAFNNKCRGDIYPDYNYLFTKEYSPHKDTVA